MNRQKEEREKLRKRLIGCICQMGHPSEFAGLIADSLGTEKTMERMISYLGKTGVQSAEQITDEMLAIVSERDRWVEKKKNEYYNQKYNEMRYMILEADEE